MKDSDYPEQPSDGDQTHEIGNRTFVIADVEPLDVDGTRTVAVGTALFALAFVVLLPFYGRLDEAGRSWWVWTCLSGVVLGLIGWEYCRRRRDRRRARPPGRD